jgi:outer membrane usher protein FimD/PapC
MACNVFGLWLTDLTANQSDHKERLRRAVSSAWLKDDARDFVRRCTKSWDFGLNFIITLSRGSQSPSAIEIHSPSWMQNSMAVSAASAPLILEYSGLSSVLSLSKPAGWGLGTG